MLTFVYCTTQFEGFHCWPDAKSSESYLKNRHRHIFHVKVTCPAKHNDRDVEFINLKHLVERSIIHLKETTFKGNESCEMMAELIIKDFKNYSPSIKIHSIEISEDGENGAIVVCQ
jgi:hypothetical protein